MGKLYGNGVGGLAVPRGEWAKCVWLRNYAARDTELLSLLPGRREERAGIISGIIKKRSYLNQGGQILSSLQALISVFRTRCPENSTMEELEQLLKDPDRWIEAHALFDRIRRKTLEADKSKNHLLAVQYSFEEICTKTLFNLANTDAPFDPDSPYFIVPFAIYLARALQISDEEVIRIVAPPASATHI